MEIARYICKACNKVKVKSIRTGESVFTRQSCKECGRLSSAVLEQLKVVSMEEYLDDIEKVLTDTTDGAMDDKTLLAVTMRLADREITTLEAKNKDLVAGLTELKEWAVEEAEDAEKHKNNVNAVISCRAYSRSKVLLETIEHCEAVIG